MSMKKMPSSQWKNTRNLLDENERGDKRENEKARKGNKSQKTRTTNWLVNKVSVYVCAGWGRKVTEQDKDRRQGNGGEERLISYMGRGVGRDFKEAADSKVDHLFMETAY